MASGNNAALFHTVIQQLLVSYLTYLNNEVIYFCRWWIEMP